MSAYIFTIRDYHAIKEAKIRIEGLTVLAGVNGSGKSTVARWFNRIVKVLNDYEKIINGLTFEQYQQLLQDIKRGVTIAPSVRTSWNRLSRSLSLPDSPDKIPAYIRGVIEQMTVIMSENLSPSDWQSNYQRLCSAYDIDPVEDESVDKFFERVYLKFSERSENLQRWLREYLGNHTMRNLRSTLTETIDNTIDDSNISVSLTEDGVELLSSDNFLQPLNLHNSLYIETQTLTNPLYLFAESELATYIRNVYASPSINEKAIATSVKKIIGGTVMVDEEKDLLINEDQFRYLREDGLDILLRGAATGIISFSYILRLLENGWINKDSVLIIDEPEAHLHPQWIVEYARVLVLINKHIGAKVLISTHSPDMVAAIRSISERQEILGTTLFYLAVADGNNKYVYQDLGHDIGPIFDSFNIASERIDQYGVS